MNELQAEVKGLLLSRTRSLRDIADKHKISLPTLSRIKNDKEVSDKTLVYLKEILK